MASAIPSGPPVFIIHDGRGTKTYTNAEDVQKDLRGRKYTAIKTETNTGVVIEIKVVTTWEVVKGFFSPGKREQIYKGSDITPLLTENEARKTTGIGERIVYSAPPPSGKEQTKKIDEFDEDSKRLFEIKTTRFQLSDIAQRINSTKGQMRNAVGNEDEFAKLQKGLTSLEEEQAKLRALLGKLTGR